MTLDFLTRPIGGSRKKDKDTAADGQSKRGVHGQVPSVPDALGASSGATLLVGATPRVDLMPPEIRLKRSQLRTRRSLRAALVAVLVATLLGCAGTFAWNTITRASLVLAQAEQQGLLAQQSKFGQVATVSDQIALIEAGQRVGSSTEVQWSPYISKLQVALPAGTSLEAVSVEAASPTSVFDQPTAPLLGGRIATLSIQTRSPELPSVADLIAAVETLPGYSDVSPVQITSSEGVYQASFTMHVGTAALDNRFAKAGH